MIRLASPAPPPDAPPLTPHTERVLAIEAVGGHVVAVDASGAVTGPCAVDRRGGPPSWELIAAVLPDRGHDVVIVAGPSITAGSVAHFGWLRALQPQRLFVCRRSVHLLWRHPEMISNDDERLTAYAEIAAVLVAGETPPDRLRQIAVAEITELDTDLDRIICHGPTR